MVPSKVRERRLTSTRAQPPDNQPTTILPKPSITVVDPKICPQRKDASAALTWVNISDPSDKNNFKRQIRSHARTYAHIQRRKTNSNQQKPPSFVSTPLIYQRSNWGYNPFVKLPVEVTNDFKQFMHSLSLDDRPMVVYYRSAYFDTVSCTDSEGAFYSSMSLIPTVMCTQTDTPEPLRQYYERQDLRYSSKAMKQIRAQLVNEHQVRTSYGLISAVASLLIKDQMRFDWTSAAVHFNALEKIIRLRGGLDGVESWTKLLIVFIDVVTSYNQDHKPRLTKPEDHLEISAPVRDWYTAPNQNQVPSGVRLVAAKLRKQYPENEKMTALLEEVAVLNEPRKDDNTTDEETYKTGRVILFRLLISLLSAHSVLDYNNESSIMSEILRSALLMFIISKGESIPDTNFMLHATQMSKLRHIFQFHEPDWTGLLELRAWVVAIALVIAEGDDVEWWTAEWKAVLGDMAVKEPRPMPLAYCVFENSGSKSGNGIGLERGKKSVGGLLRVPDEVSDIMWVESIHGRLYREIFSRS